MTSQRIFKIISRGRRLNLFGPPDDDDLTGPENTTHDKMNTAFDELQKRCAESNTNPQFEDSEIDSEGPKAYEF